MDNEDDINEIDEIKFGIIRKYVKRQKHKNNQKKGAKLIIFAVENWRKDE